MRLYWMLLSTLLTASYSSTEAQQVPSSAVVCYFVARAYLNPVNGQGQVVDYFANCLAVRSERQDEQ